VRRFPPPAMIEAAEFVEAARARGFRRYAGVPCSFLTPFINFVLQDRALEYVSMANEGDAVALNAGVALAGEDGRPHRTVTLMQNSGLGNAVSPLTSLTWTFRLPQLLIVTWRGQPGVADEPQHALMGPITPAMLETMEIPWELFPTDGAAVGAALDRAVAHMETTGRPYALLMQKGSVAPCELVARSDANESRLAATNRASRGQTSPGVSSPRGAARAVPQARATRQEALRQLIAHTPAESTAVLASTGYCGRELCALADRANQLYMVGSMGCVTPFALGLALARPELEVVAVDGDGAALMRMGAFATVGAYAPRNLKHLLLDNGVHDSTGGQATVSPRISFAGVAAACGYADAIETDDLHEIGEWLDAPALDGPRFARLRIRPGTPHDLPRPSLTPVEVRARLMRHFAAPGGSVEGP
jgi:phosphonopyruvate decarboxylase